MTENELAGRGKRLFSLDLLRGMDMFLLTVVAPFMYAIDGVYALPPAVLDQFQHPWEGFTLYDIIMPLFLFMSGAAVPFSLEKRLAKSGGRPDAAYWKHVAWRLVMLWGLGLVVQGRLLDFDLDTLRLFDNTLEAIAVGFAAMSLLVLVKSMKVKSAIVATAFVVYGLLLHFLGDYSLNGNFAAFVEQKILLAITPAASETAREIAATGIPADSSGFSEELLARGGEVHYTWYLTSLMFFFNVAAGYFATKILLATADRVRNCRRLFLYGLALLALGWLLAFGGVKMVKHIYTVSFTAQAVGWSALALAALYYLTDIRSWRKGTQLFLLFGRTSLVCYMAGECFWGTYLHLGGFLTHGLYHAFEPSVHKLYATLAGFVLLYFTLRLREMIGRKS